MEWVVYIVGLIMIGFAVYQIIKIRKSGDITEEAWAEIRIIGYETIEKLMQLYTIRTNKEEFIDFVINEIKEKIDKNEKLTEIDRSFWNKERLSTIFKPVLNGLIEKFEN